MHRNPPYMYIVHVFPIPSLPVYLIKRPNVFTARLEHLIDDSTRMRLILDARSRHHTQRRSPSHTPLQLLRNTPLIPRKKLPCKPTLSTQRTRPNLQTRLVSQIIILDLKLEMIPRMHHLMRHGILLMSSVPKLIRTKQYAVIETEPPTLLVCAHATQNVLVVEVAAEFGDFVFEKTHHGRVFEEVGAVGLAALADAIGFEGVHFGEVGLFERDVARARHAAEHDAEGAGPVVVDGVEGLFGWRRGHGGEGGAVGRGLGVRHRVCGGCVVVVGAEMLPSQKMLDMFDCGPMGGDATSGVPLLRMRRASSESWA
jgi:hypothetical protein